MVYGVAVVVPLALGGPARPWVAAGAAAFVSFLLPTGLPAAALVVPVGVLAALAVLDRGVRWDALPSVWALVAAQSLVTSRGGWVVLDQHEPFVLLTAVHYLFAGVGALTLARHAGGRVAVGATAAAPPVIAAGFLLDADAPLIAGAVLLTVGVWATAVHQLRERRPLLVLSALSVLAPMVLAVLWALANRWPDVPHLGISAMVPAHGLPNALGFVTLGLVARRRVGRQP